MIRLLLALVLIFSIFSCDSLESYEPSIKPEMVPHTAFWVGGSDGGVYIDIKQDASIKNKFHSRIYFDFTGEIWYEGWLYYSGADVLNVKDKSIYSFWDGDILYLINNEYLTKEAL